MKQLLVKLMICAILAGLLSYNSNAQTRTNRDKPLPTKDWRPNPIYVIKTISKVQCWGTTSKGTRCKRMIDPKHPNGAIMDSGGVYYCYQHARQAQ